ncbi:dienelactone hydrolase family protein [Arenibaculum pallidiluteum]|uniref:dienelactone hydrolase family protein n=1 Tax=Arenibaculum pallidiluteum TaxID=2812559 RepID=UPI001F28D978|nr:dienelactone hydrolase family protein [Arenibaculum pallidiluteum]
MPPTPLGIAGAILALLLVLAAPGNAAPGAAGAAPGQVSLDGPWPEARPGAGIEGQAVTFPSRSPFMPADMADPTAAPETMAMGTLFLPPGDTPARSLAAVVLLHGSGGVLAARELTYGAQLARMGVAALVVDSFAARRDLATGFVQRILEITESMIVADAYAGLRYLAGLPTVDPGRVALVGFSYGGMAAMYALNAGVAGLMAPDGLRFAAHASFYGPCIARFEDTRTTGAPMLMLWGDADELIDAARCETVATEMREGGSRVETRVYAGAVHQWDGPWGRRPTGRLLTNCRFAVGSDGTVRDENTGFPMAGALMRKALLALCVEDRPYQIGRDDAVRALSTRDLGRFLDAAIGG